MSEKPMAPTRRQLDAFDNGDYTSENVEQLRAEIRDQVLSHREQLGLPSNASEILDVDVSKDFIRRSHAAQREEYRAKEEKFVVRHGLTLLQQHFADGAEVDPKTVEPVLSIVKGGSEESDLFRLTTLLWRSEE